MKQILIDGRYVDSVVDIHTLFSKTLGFPEAYGRNMDALYDCLTDVSEDVTIRVEHRPELFESIGRYERILVRVLRDAVKVNDHLILDIEEEIE